MTANLIFKMQKPPWRLLVFSCVAALVSPLVLAQTVCVAPADAPDVDKAKCIRVDQLESQIMQWNAACKSRSQPRLTVQFTAGSFHLAKPLSILDISCPAGLEIAGQGPSTVLTGSTPVRLQRNRALGRTRMGDAIYSGSLTSAMGGRPAIDEGRNFGKSSPEMLEVFLTDSRIPVARGPKKGSLRLDKDLTQNSATVYQIPSLGKRYRGESNIRLGGFLKYDWADELIPVRSIDRNGVLELMRAPLYGIQSNARYWIENAVADFMDSGGWIYQTDSGSILVADSKDLAELDIEVSSNLLGISIENSRNVTIHGLRIEKMRGDGIAVENSTDIRMHDLDIRLVGSTGIRVSGVRMTLENLIVTNVGGSGIAVNGGDRKALNPGQVTVDHVKVEHVGRRQIAYMPAVSLSGVGNTLKNSELVDGPHSAIVFHGNNHLIANNRISNFASDVDDTGIIYTGRDWTERGTLVTGNYVEAASRGSGGAGVRVIYLDDQASGIRIEDNVLVGGRFGIFIGGGRDNQIKGNLLVGCESSIGGDSRGLNWQSKQLASMAKKLTEFNVSRAPYATQYPRIAQLGPDDYGNPAGNVFLKNMIASCGNGAFRDQFEAGLEWGENIMVTNTRIKMPQGNFDVPNYLRTLRSESGRGIDQELKKP